MNYKNGELVLVKEVGNTEAHSLCMVVKPVGVAALMLESYFMVYSITHKEKFIVTTHFMKKIG